MPKRTDANATEGLDEAIFRARKFYEMGVDITFVEAPRSQDEMRAYCDQVPRPKMANMLEQGVTPLLRPDRLQELGDQIAAYPLTMILAGLSAMENALSRIKQGQLPDRLSSFEHLKDVVGFPLYFEAEKKYVC